MLSLPKSIATAAAPAVTDAIAVAKDAPTLAAGLEQVDPALAKQVEGDALAKSKGPIGTLAVTAVTYLSSRYGLGWDANTCALVAGVALLAAGYVARLYATHPITGWFRKAPPAAK